MKLKMMEYNGAMVLAVAGERQSLIIREEDGGFTFELLAEGHTLPVFTLESAREAVQDVQDVREAQEETHPTDILVEPVATLEREAEEDAPHLESQPAVEEKGLFEALTALRKELATADGVPPYLIFHNKTLHEMVAKMPSDMQALGTVVGVGQAKLDKYGPLFLEAIAKNKRTEPDAL